MRRQEQTPVAMDWLLIRTKTLNARPCDTQAVMMRYRSLQEY